VPATNPTVTVDLEYQTEATWDFVFVQVYDTAQKKWVSLANANTTSTNVDPQYAGQDVKIAVRYMTDGSTVEAGAWLSGLSVGGTPLADATDLSKWTSLTGAVPTPVDSWTVQLVGWNGTQVSAVTLPLTAGSNTWTGDVSDTLGIAPEFAGFIVTANDPTLGVSQYADYTLTSGTAGGTTTGTPTGTTTGSATTGKGKKG
jgi:hypothetical protein